jgi:hypothetical protein
VSEREGRGGAPVTGSVVGLSWGDLVDAATVGLTRRPLRAVSGAGAAGAAADAADSAVRLGGVAGRYSGVLDGTDAAGTVLDAAALVSAGQRAGMPVAEGVRGPAAADPDTGPELSRRAASVVRRAMAAEPGVLADLLAAAGRRGYRVPAPMLPGLLDLAGRDVSLRPAVAGVLGSRGRWLAHYRPDWQRVAETGVARVPDDPAIWETRRRDERRGYLAQLRARDGAAARELLAAGWDRETGDDRAGLLLVLADELSLDDEEFLDAALADRKGAVRDEAARLLARLPGSAFSRRAADRAAGLLRVERHALRRRLVAGAPAEGTLGQVVAAAPLALWEERFGLAAEQIVGLPVEGVAAAEVQAGWRVAAVREGNAAWAEALLAAGPAALGSGEASGAGALGGSGGFGGTGAGGAGGVQGVGGARGAAGWRDPAVWRRPAGWPEAAELAASLTPAARADRGVALLGELAAGRVSLAGAVGGAAITEVAGYPGPWPDELARAVLGVLRRGLAAGPGRWSGPLLAAAARNLPVHGPDDYAAALTELADECPPIWSAPLRRTAGAVAARRIFLEEIR